MIDLHQRKREATEKRLAELLALPGMVNSQQVRDILDRQFEAGVHAHSDYIEASRFLAMEKERERFNRQRETAPVAFMGCEPGTMLQLLRKEGE
jgi:hypothetical protein